MTDLTPLPCTRECLWLACDMQCSLDLFASSAEAPLCRRLAHYGERHMDLAGRGTEEANRSGPKSLCSTALSEWTSLELCLGDLQSEWDHLRRDAAKEGK